VLNALNKATWADLRTAFEDAGDDAAVRGVILTGAGDKAFIAGADISELALVTAFKTLRTAASVPIRGKSSFLVDVTPIVTPVGKTHERETAKALILLARSERFELPTLRFEV
jgi:hypothetical protein